MKLPGMPNLTDLAPLAERAVIALERIAEALEAAEDRATQPPPPKYTRKVATACGCTYNAEANADLHILASGVWERVEVCPVHQEQGARPGHTFVPENRFGVAR
ncbi:hypothetical protein J3996_gp76 [Mycobacterium phage Laurie]|uniref:Uncharacterized protein n=1 Tax=Mycobacterium phage Laurie TaxID=1874015 RepID=A0A1B2IHU8_9CAUD|nr:hypothetical protein J3996_gp76 [Mycobacterium phage Laurie]ANZ52370.1 hypothetical protein SEA_LAURIE_76 [Mycobacterium phage Laurie]